MIANRRRREATSRKSASRLPAVSAAWTDNSVTLPPDRERLATRPAPIGSNRKCKNDGYRRSRLLQSGNCATISDNNINVLSDELRSKFSDAGRDIPPTSDIRSRWCDPRSSRFRAVAAQKLPPTGSQPEALSPRNPMIGSFAGCARAASGRDAAAPCQGAVHPDPTWTSARVFCCDAVHSSGPKIVLDFWEDGSRPSTCAH